ncbi:hypothetical protein Q1695_015994 [Nippostrongylus brasiliensis]|nr:hypothetical protein Q1695_015994 [Nippostrongylus brasiliensis]
MSTKSPRSLYVLVTIQAAHLVTACPPQPIGNCYAGTVLISSPYTGGIVTRKCAPTLNREWCAVSFYASTSTASFGCANDFTIPFGSMTCGDGPGFINQQGCSMANTASGPCYFCCCRGGSCNHPEVFAREALRVAGSGFQSQTFQGLQALQGYQGVQVVPGIQGLQEYQQLLLRGSTQHVFTMQLVILLLFIPLTCQCFP